MTYMPNFQRLRVTASVVAAALCLGALAVAIPSLRRRRRSSSKK